MGLGPVSRGAKSVSELPSEPRSSSFDSACETRRFTSPQLNQGSFTVTRPSIKRLLHISLRMTFMLGACMPPIFAGREMAESAELPRLIRTDPGWPTVVELNVGDSYKVARLVDGKTITRWIKVISVSHRWEPDYWIEDNPDHKTLNASRVVIDVSDVETTLLHRPYQMPTTVNGLRVYVESTQRWAVHGRLAGMPEVARDVRLSIVAEGETWGPPLVYPIADYRWRSSTYSNTWCSLVPYNLLYYHRGEDRGAIPDRLPVLAMLDGTIERSPLPDGDGRSNGLSITSPSGLGIAYAHMNIETVDPKLTVGAKVKAGQILGKTGMTWAGRRSQTHDPHLHVGFRFNDTYLSTYPFFVEAYLRSYPDPVLPIAGGYYFALPGDSVELDGARSIARPGRKVVSHTWRLHDGAVVENSVARVTYEEPGLYSEQLSVRTDAGDEDRDFAQVRVFDPDRGRKLARGWAYYTPVRGITPGTTVLFWNRLVGMAGPVTIDFGDGSPKQTIHREVEHAYAESGLYTVTLSGRGPDDEPATVRQRVIVE